MIIAVGDVDHNALQLTQNSIQIRNPPTCFWINQSHSRQQQLAISQRRVTVLQATTVKLSNLLIRMVATPSVDNSASGSISLSTSYVSLIFAGLSSTPIHAKRKPSRHFLLRFCQITSPLFVSPDVGQLVCGIFQ